MPPPSDSNGQPATDDIVDDSTKLFRNPNAPGALGPEPLSLSGSASNHST